MHSHRSLADVLRIIDRLDLPLKVREDMKGVYKILADAESKAHGVSVGDVHFHEVGMLDAIVDIAAVCLMINEIGPRKIIASPVRTGKGYVKCAHGILPVPAPATKNIIKDMPTYKGDIQGELLTPTGAALLKYFVDEFEPDVDFDIEEIGYGMGKKKYEKPNCVKIYKGRLKEKEEKVILLETNIDDMTGEEIGFAASNLREMGAKEVYLTPVYMKKDRPGILLTVLTDEDRKRDFIRAIFKYTKTLGIREIKANRYTLDRRERKMVLDGTEFRIKDSKGFGTENTKIEFDDLKEHANKNNLSLKEVTKRLEKALKKKEF